MRALQFTREVFYDIWEQIALHLITLDLDVDRMYFLKL